MNSINNLSQTTNTRNVTLSVAKHVLGLTDAYLSGLGFTGDAIEVERQRRFHEWVAAHQRADANTGKPIWNLPLRPTSCQAAC